MIMKKSRGEISVGVIITLTASAIIGLTGLIYKNLTEDLDKTTELALGHEREIAILESDSAKFKDNLSQVSADTRFVRDAVIQIAAVQGIKLSTSTKP